MNDTYLRGYYNGYMGKEANWLQSISDWYGKLTPEQKRMMGAGVGALGAGALGWGGAKMMGSRNPGIAGLLSALAGGAGGYYGTRPENDYLGKGLGWAADRWGGAAAPPAEAPPAEAPPAAAVPPGPNHPLHMSLAEINDMRTRMKQMEQDEAQAARETRANQDAYARLMNSYQLPATTDAQDNQAAWERMRRSATPPAGDDEVRRMREQLAKTPGVR